MHPYLGSCTESAGWVSLAPKPRVAVGTEHGLSGLGSDKWREILASTVHNEVATKIRKEKKILRVSQY